MLMEPEIGDMAGSKLTRPGLLQPGTSRSAHPDAQNQSRTRLFDQSLYLRAQRGGVRTGLSELLRNM